MRTMMMRGIVLSVVLGSGLASALDLPTQYRAAFFQDDPTKYIKDWQTSIEARIGYGDSRHTYDQGNFRKPLLSGYGPMNIVSLGWGLNASNKTPNPTTNMYWNAAGTGLFDPSNTANLGPNDGMIQMGGRFRDTEYNLTLQQALCLGLYFQIYVPIREVQIDQITTQNLGAANIGTIPVNVTTFLNTALPLILQEQGFNKGLVLNTPFKKTDCGDIIASLGWHGYQDGLHGMVNAIGGMVQAGAILPTAGTRDEDLIFSIPVGYNNHYGVLARAAVELGLWKVLALGVQAGTEIFFTDEKEMRMMTDPSQTGWLFLGKGRADVDSGAIWDVGGYFKFDQFVDGLAVIIGYSFTTQEYTWLHVEDNNFLYDVIKADQTPPIPLAVVNPRVQPLFAKSKDSIVNGDQRQHRWESHVFHAVLQYQPHCWSVNPLIKAEYACPIYGKSNFDTDMVAGTLGLSIGWGF